MSTRSKSPAGSNRLREIVNQFPRARVAVLADLVADEFVYGEISRVSREAPVLILKHRERTILPGGGANAVYNLADLGVKVLPVGVVGDDEAGRLLIERFHDKKIPTTGIVTAKGHTTVTKTRILAGMTHTSRQQVVRVDREPDKALTASIESQLTQAARKFLGEADALLISDYGYGAATPALFDSLRSNGSLNGMPVALDSRYRMLEYQGVTSATPNEPEVEEALQLKIASNGKGLYEAGKELLSRMKLDSLVITRGRDGMVAFSRGKKPVEIPIHGSDQVADVTGAGDTVIATFTAALAVGADAESAARLANYAGGIVVMKRGTATVTRAELLAALE
jgi:D-glycero-beta-D-manno-heptose-7-phosphate kinase